MGYAIALASAALYGSADFIGGLTARRTNTMAAVLISQFAGLAMLILMLPFLEGAPTRGDFGWGAAAGMAGGTGVALLYRALAVGTMAVVAPITAVCAVAIPVIVAMALGERPATLALFGIVLALVAIALVGQQTSVDVTSAAPRPSSSGISLALMSGVAIGLFFLFLARTAPAAGLWPLLSARTASVSVFAIGALVRQRTLRMPAPVLALVVCGGVIDMLANLLYLIATRSGPLSIIVTLSSLYPASTVILARMVLGEKLSVWQGAGIVCALVAVVMIVGGA